MLGLGPGNVYCPPGLVFKILKVWMRLCACVYGRRMFCADEEEGNELRAVKARRQRVASLK